MKIVNIKILNSVVCLGGAGEDELVEEISNIDLSDKTPLDCMEIIRRLKKKYGSRKTAGV